MSRPLPPIINKLDPNMLLKCYYNVTRSEKIHDHFNRMEFESKEDRLKIYKVYVNMMLGKCMKEKGYEGLDGWTGTTGGKLRTSGGNCTFSKKLIQIADWMIESDITKFDDIKETILHEIAHANSWLKYGVKDHGPVWIREARLIGCTGDRCLPKKYTALLMECVVYKCKYPSNKCLCIKTGSKQSINNFSRKMPNLVCKNHRVPFDYIETTSFDPEFKIEDFKKRYSFGNKNEFIEIDDGEVIEVDKDGDVYTVDPNICLKYD
jgi:predicted SprT family Zn-dependent metalloprotease